MRVRLLEDESILEMSNFSKNASGLPANVWIDDSGWWKSAKHNCPRIKIQGNRSSHIDNSNLIPMSIGDNPQILISNPRNELSDGEVNVIKKFVVKYKNQLMALAQNDGSYDFVQFVDLVRKNGI